MQKKSCNFKVGQKTPQAPKTAPKTRKDARWQVPPIPVCAIDLNGPWTFVIIVGTAFELAVEAVIVVGPVEKSLVGESLLFTGMFHHRGSNTSLPCSTKPCRPQDR